MELANQLMINVGNGTNLLENVQLAMVDMFYPMENAAMIKPNFVYSMTRIIHVLYALPDLFSLKEHANKFMVCADNGMKQMPNVHLVMMDFIWTQGNVWIGLW